MNAVPKDAIVLAAGLGTRMRPITDRIPKPLVEVAGKALIDHGLDALRDAGVERAAVNVHYLPDPLIRHLSNRDTPSIMISDERDRLLDSGGGVAKAVGLMDVGGPFLILNADTFWIDAAGTNNLRAFARMWDADRMDMLLMLVRMDDAVGHSSAGDFEMDGECGPLRRSGRGYVYAGVAITSPALFRGDEDEKHSLNLHFDRAIEAGRLFGWAMDGLWLTVGTPDAIGVAERAVTAYRSDTSA